MKMIKRQDSEAFEVPNGGDGMRMGCCDCGLVHDVAFVAAVAEDGKPSGLLSRLAEIIVLQPKCAGNCRPRNSAFGEKVYTADLKSAHASDAGSSPARRTIEQPRERHD